MKDKNKATGNDEIPYEVRMKYIIDAYRKDQQKWGKLVEHAKHLEAEVIRLKDLLIANGFTDSGEIGDGKPANMIKELKEKVIKLEGKLKELKDVKNTMKNLEYQVSTFPLRTYKTIYYKNIIRSQDNYIEELQKLLDEHEIVYHPRMPIYDDNEEEKILNAVDDAVEYIVKYQKEHSRTDPNDDKGQV